MTPSEVPPAALVSTSHYNPPGQKALDYRVGTYATFLQDLLDHARTQTIPTGRYQGIQPLHSLNLVSQHDWIVALFKAWAVVGDILAFYQERIVNEGYLGTATERRSVMELARALGYEMSPGVAASTWLAFMLRSAPSVPERLTIPQGPDTAVQSIPAPGHTPVTFETTTAIEARAQWHAMKPYMPMATQPQTIRVGSRVGSTELRLQGVQTGLRPGALLLITDQVTTGTSGPSWYVRTAQKVEANRDAGYTLVCWKEPLEAPTGAARDDTVLREPQVFTFAQQAALFGHNAAQWSTLVAAIKEQDGLRQGGVFATADIGTGWTPSNTNLPSQSIQALAFTESGDFLAAGSTGIFRSTGVGDEWSPSMRGVTKKNVYALLLAPDGHLFAGTLAGGVFRSVDQGVSWDNLSGGTIALRYHLFTGWKPANTRMPNTTVRALATHADRARRETWLFAGTDNGVLYSTISGNGWTPMNKGLPGFNKKTRLARAVVFDLVIDTAQGHLFAATDQGLFFAKKAGKRWRPINKGLPHTTPILHLVCRLLSALFRTIGALLPKKVTSLARRLVVWGQKILAKFPRVIKSLVNRLKTGLDNIVLALCTKAYATTTMVYALVVSTDPHNGQTTLFAGTNYGLFVSTNSGRSWQPPNTSWSSPVRALKMATGPHGQTLVAGTDEGVFTSTDNGATRMPVQTAPELLFEVSARFQTDLDKGELAEFLRQEFANNGIPLSAHAHVKVKTLHRQWRIEDAGQTYTVTKLGTAQDAPLRVSYTPILSPVRALACNADGHFLAAAPFGGFVHSDWPHFQLSASRIDLDRTYLGIVEGGWAVLQQSHPIPLTGVYPVQGVSTTVRQKFSQTGKVTEMATHVTPTDTLLSLFNLRETTVALQSRQLDLFAPRVPQFTPIDGVSIRLQGLVQGLASGQLLSVTGKPISAALGSTGGVWRLPQGTQAWTSMGLVEKDVRALTYDAQGTLYAGTTCGVWRYASETWTSLGSIGKDCHIQTLLADGQGHLIAGTTDGVWYTAVGDADTGALSWMSGGLDGVSVHALLRDEQGKLYAGTAQGVFSLAQLGATWQSLNEGLPQVEVWALVAEGPGRLTAGTAQGVFSMVLPDGPWQPHHTGLANWDVRALLVDSQGVLYVGTAGAGVFALPDRAGSWRSRNAGLTHRDVQALVLDKQGSLYAGTTGGSVFCSTDRGLFWNPVSTGVANDIRTLVVNAQGDVLAGTSNVTFLTSTDGLKQLALQQEQVGTLAMAFSADLDQHSIPEALREALKNQHLDLGPNIQIVVQERGTSWHLYDGGDDQYIVRKGEDQLQIYASQLLRVLAPPTPVHGQPTLSTWHLRDTRGREGVLMAGTDDITPHPALSDYPTISEIATIDAAQVASSQDYTTVTLTRHLQYSYDPFTLTCNANVASATQGETVLNEVLGSGNAAQANQQFVLKRPPLTYVSASTPSGRKSTLAVYVTTGIRSAPTQRLGEIKPKQEVEKVLWQEVPSLYNAPPHSREYMIRTGELSKTTLTFGNGVAGERLPTGEENVTATYRHGMGRSGNVPAGSLSMLKKRPPGVQRVTNPISASGGTDPETRQTAYRRAPLTVRPLDRVVSIQDYEDFTRLFSGIGKAKTSVLRHGAAQLVHITIAAADGKPVLKNSELYQNLLKAIEAVRAIPQPMQIDSFAPLFFNVEARVSVKPDLVETPVNAAIWDVLMTAYSFENREFGQPVMASEVVTLIQDVPGVVAVELEALYVVGFRKWVEQRLPAALAQWDEERDAIEPAELLLLNPNEDAHRLSMEHAHD